MGEWIEEFAGLLGEDAVTPEEMGDLLILAREVAHGTEDRRLAPLSTFLVGVHAGRAGNGAAGRAGAVADALAAARALLPSGGSDQQPEGGR